MEDYFGVDFDGPLPTQEWSGIHTNIVNVPETTIPSGHMHEVGVIDPLRHSEYNGVDVYVETVSLLENLI